VSYFGKFFCPKFGYKCETTGASSGTGGAGGTGGTGGTGRYLAGVNLGPGTSTSVQTGATSQDVDCQGHWDANPDGTFKYSTCTQPCLDLTPTQGNPVRPQGTQKVNFIVEAQPRGNGKSCLQVAQSSDPTAYVDEVTGAIVGKQRDCNSHACQVNCTMGAWSPDPNAPADCVGGNQLYTRSMTITQTLSPGQYTVMATCPPSSAYGAIDPTVRSHLCPPTVFNGTGTCPSIPQDDISGGWTFKDQGRYGYIDRGDQPGAIFYNDTSSIGSGNVVWNPNIVGPGCFHNCLDGCGAGGIGSQYLTYGYFKPQSTNNSCKTYCENGSTSPKPGSTTHFSTTTGAIVQPSSIGCPTGYTWDGQMPHVATDPKTGVTSNTFWCVSDSTHTVCPNPNYPRLDRSLNPPMCVAN
jgi:hypothetical protein